MFNPFRRKRAAAPTGPRYVRKPKVHRTSYLTRARQATSDLVSRLRAEREKRSPSFARQPRPDRLAQHGGRHRKPLAVPATVNTFLTRAHGSAARTRSAARTVVARAAAKVGADATGPRLIRWHGAKRPLFHRMTEITAEHNWKIDDTGWTAQPLSF